MIVTVTLNPTIDKNTTVEQLIPEKKLRCTEMLIEAGGGGINVSKAISELGGETRAIFTCGGLNGKLLLELLEKDSVQTLPVQIEGTTRESIMVTETSTNKEYKFIVPGPVVNENELQAIRSTISNLKDESFLICSGSLPLNVPEDFLAEIAALAKEKRIKFIVDTSGPVLKKALKEGVYLIKPNMSELCFLAGVNYLEADEIEEAVDKIILQGECEVIVVSMGASGAMLATKNFKKRLPAPIVKKVSTVGAGDSMLAGIVWMLEHKKSLEDAVRFGIACGTAATVMKGPHLFKKEDAYKFFEWLKKIS
jgi:6-phosphofructokinase 2